MAIARCSSINPITGQSQSSTITTVNYNSYGQPRYSTSLVSNALQINPSGDLRILALPATSTIQDYLCPFQANLRESTWPGYNC